MFEYRKNDYIIISDNHKLSDDVLSWFPYSVYNILIPKMKYYTCRYYKYMNDPFSEQYMYNQSLAGIILVWGMRTIEIGSDESKVNSIGESISKKKKQYIAVYFKDNINNTTNPLSRTYNHLIEEKLDVPLNYFIIRELIININTFEIRCNFCNTFCIQMKMKIHNNTDIVCSNQKCFKSLINLEKITFDQGRVLINYADLPNYYNPNIRYYCTICFNCKLCIRIKSKDKNKFCKKHIQCIHMNRSKSEFNGYKTRKLKSLKTIINKN